ncbi:hypothetical protein [Streptomyces sp. NBC_01766]|nr:hypothetical protein [Streptomyces sp. NBC_01766]WSC24990.1 hypothetical protein OIE60_35640 [Streptomyces sp. NBC_01766]
MSTHSFWETLGGEDLVEARMALKHSTGRGARRHSLCLRGVP